MPEIPLLHVAGVLAGTESMGAVYLLRGPELRRFVVSLTVIATAALVGSLPAGAKDQVQATLMSTIPLEAPAGRELKVSWKLFSVDENGQRVPFGANGVFVRLLSASGSAAAEGVAPVGAYPTGEYEATVVVPEGGIGDVQIGLMGWASDAAGTRRSDAMFPITNDPVPGTSANSAASDSGSGRSGSLAIVLAGALAMLAAFAAALVVRKRGRRYSAPAAR